MPESRLRNLTKALNLVAGRDARGMSLDQVKTYNASLVMESFSTDQAIFDDGSRADRTEVSSGQFRAKSAVAVPLRIRDKVFGVVYLDSGLAKGLFGQDDIGLLSMISQYIAIAFETSKMAKIEIEKANLKKELEIQSAVAAESKKVKMLVDNMQQSLFSVDSSGSVEEPVSKYSETVFGADIVKKNILDILYRNLKNEERDSLKGALAMVFGEGQDQWELMQSNFPTKVHHLGEAAPSAEASSGAADARILKVLPSPIWDGQGLLEKLLFVVEDVTNLEALQLQVAGIRRRSAMLEEVIDNKIEDVGRFIHSSMQMLSGYVESAKKGSKFGLDDLLRDLHTLKGNARFYHLKNLSEQVHMSESALVEFVKTAPLDGDKDAACSAEINIIVQIIREYDVLVSKLAPQRTETVRNSSLSETKINEIRATIDRISGSLDAAAASQINLLKKRLSFSSLRDSLLKYEDMLQDLASQLDKKVTLQIEGDALATEEQLRVLDECFLHLFRNSIDHGVESPDVRLSRGKPIAGATVVTLVDNLESFQIDLVDDGKGMDAESLRSKAVEKKLISSVDAKQLTQQECLNLIFLPGFSSKEAATDISGRGIGMDVVKTNINRLNGTITIDSKSGVGSKFTIVIRHS